jgi:hypothetical protein
MAAFLNVQTELNKLQERDLVCISPLELSTPTSSTLRVKAQGAPLDLCVLAKLASNHNLDWRCILTAPSEQADQDYGVFVFQERQYRAIGADFPALVPLKEDWGQDSNIDPLVKYVAKTVLVSSPRPQTLKLKAQFIDTSTWVLLCCEAVEGELSPQIEMTSMMLSNIVNDDRISNVHLRGNAIFVELSAEPTGSKKRRLPRSITGSPRPSKRHRVNYTSST